jgi:hypothetical protein
MWLPELTKEGRQFVDEETGLGMLIDEGNNFRSIILFAVECCRHPE